MSALSNLYGMFPLKTGPSLPDINQSYFLPPIKDLSIPSDLDLNFSIP